MSDPPSDLEPRSAYRDYNMALMDLPPCPYNICEICAANVMIRKLEGHEASSTNGLMPLWRRMQFGALLLCGLFGTIVSYYPKMWPSLAASTDGPWIKAAGTVTTTSPVVAYREEIPMANYTAINVARLIIMKTINEETSPSRLSKTQYKELLEVLISDLEMSLEAATQELGEEETEETLRLLGR